MLRRVILAFAAAGMLCAYGCYTQKQVQSGFLGENYARMEAVDGNPKHLFYANPAKHIGDYDAVIVDPVVARMAPDAPGADLDPEEVKQMTDFMHDELVRQLSQQHNVVTEPGPGVARVQAAITGLTPEHPGANVLPQTKLTGIGLGGAAYESRLVDSVSGELIQCSMNASKGAMADIEGGLQVWGNARHLIEKWVAEGIEQAEAARTARTAGEELQGSE